MAGQIEELSLETVKNYMIIKGGRVTNHELVKHFKPSLTDIDNKEIARIKFKQYVNTLANISQEGGEKYLILKRKYRIGTHLQYDENEPSSPYQQSFYPQASYSSSSHISTSTIPHEMLGPASPANIPGIPPPYRPPPTYKSTIDQTYNSTQANIDYHTAYPPCNYDRRPSNPDMNRQVALDYSRSMNLQDNIYRRGSYQDPHDLGIPPAPSMNRSISSHSLISASSNSSLPRMSNSSINTNVSSNAASIQAQQNPVEFEKRKSVGSMSSHSGSRSSLAHAHSVSSISSLESAPTVPPRRRYENKENDPEAHKKGKEDHTNVPAIRVSNPVPASEEEVKVSVREATQKFNRLASESQLLSGSRNNVKANRNSRCDREDDDSPLLSSFGEEGSEWVVAASRSDFNEILRLLKLQPGLVRYRDISNGYSALHWAAKHGRAEVVKLLCGTYNLNINAKSNGGYTPLHLAAIYNRHDVFDLLTHYGADLNIRDYSGKKPRQYQTIASSTISHDKQIKIVRRRNSLKEAGGFLRIGSLNVKVRRTTEAINNLISRDVEARLHRNWGSSDSLPDSAKYSKQMPPPKMIPSKKRKTKKPDIESRTNPSTPVVTPTASRSESSLSLPSTCHDSDSDTAYGFGTEWGPETK